MPKSKANENIGKPLKSWLDDFHNTTSTISELNRKLAFALIAIVWVFRTSEHGTILNDRFSEPFVIIIILVAMALMCDLFQYIWKSINIRCWYGYKARQYDRGEIDEKAISDVKFPSYIEVGTWVFFILKLVFTIAGYLQLSYLLFQK